MRYLVSTCVVCLIMLPCCSVDRSEKSSKTSDSLQTVKIGDLIERQDTVIMKTKAALLYGKDEFDEAIKIYSDLLAIDSLNGEFNFRMGYSLAQVDRDKEAVGYLLKSSALNYRKFDSYRNIGLIYTKSNLNNNVEALRYFTKCLELNPHDEEIKKYYNSIKRESNSNNQ